MIWKLGIVLALVVCVFSDRRPAVSDQRVKLVFTSHVGDLSHHGHHKREHHEEYAWAHPSYEFSYKVDDPHTHDIKGQEETRDGDEVKGHYWLIQPDGHKRVIKYHADDKSGYTADIDYKLPHSNVYYKSKKHDGHDDAHDDAHEEKEHHGDGHKEEELEGEKHEHEEHHEEGPPVEEPHVEEPHFEEPSEGEINEGIQDEGPEGPGGEENIELGAEGAESQGEIMRNERRNPPTLEVIRKPEILRNGARGNVRYSAPSSEGEILKDERRGIEQINREEPNRTENKGEKRIEDKNLYAGIPGWTQNRPKTDNHAQLRPTFFWRDDRGHQVPWVEVLRGGGDRRRDNIKKRGLENRRAQPSKVVHYAPIPYGRKRH